MLLAFIILFNFSKYLRHFEKYDTLFFIEKDTSYGRDTQNYIVFSTYGLVFAN